MKWAKQCWLLLICLLFISCGDSAPVDKQYLESEEYTQFSEKQQEEYAAQIKSYQTLRKYLAEFINCQMGTERQLPLQINFSILKESEKECEEVDDKFNTNFDTQIFGYSHLKEVIIRWIILKKESAYEDTEFLAVTYRDGEMVGFQTVGVFRENLSQDISTHISVSRKDDFIYISSAMNRGIKYPFKYDNIIESEFYVDTLGVIRKRATQTKSYQSLPQYLEELNSCKLGKKWTFPLEINIDVLENTGERCEVLAGKFDPTFTTQSIGYSQFKDLFIRWIDLKKESVYEDRKFMAAVFRDNSLISLRTVGVFRGNSVRDIKTEIKVSPSDDLLHISSIMNRNINYPIQQKNIITNHYSINADGDIYKQK